MTSIVGTVTYSVNITPTPSPIITYSGNNTNFVINGLSKGINYNINITATNSAGSSQPSSIFNFTTQSLPNLLLYFDNNLTNSGNGIGISYTSGGVNSYVSTKKQGTHSGSFVFGTPLKYAFSNQTFPRSVAFWMYSIDGVTNTHGILSVGDMYFSIEGSGSTNTGHTYYNNITASPGGLLTFYKKSSNTPTLYFTTAGFQTTSGAKKISANVWVHIVWVANTNTSWTFYVDNTRYNVTATSTYALDNTNTEINVCAPGNRNGYNGYIDSLQVWNGYALTATDVNTLYTTP